jgi:CRP/FNR family transcriptional regulator, transcriptional activator FtrB
MVEENRIDSGYAANLPGGHSAPAKADRASNPGRQTAARNAFEEIPWLQAVPSGTLDTLAAQAILHRMPAGSLLFEQAEIPAFAQFLLSGRIELLGVRGDVETLVELLQPGDLVVPAAVIGGQPYLMRARIYEEARILLVHAVAFRNAVASDHAFCRAVLACLATQFRRRVRMEKNLKLRSAEERVGCYLVSLLGQSEASASIPLPTERRLIASHLGMTRETLSRAFSAMAKFGMRIRGDVLLVEDAATARAQFPLDPLIDGIEPIEPSEG